MKLQKHLHSDLTCFEYMQIPTQFYNKPIATCMAALEYFFQHYLTKNPRRLGLLKQGVYSAHAEIQLIIIFSLHHRSNLWFCVTGQKVQVKVNNPIEQQSHVARSLFFFYFGAGAGKPNPIELGSTYYTQSIAVTTLKLKDKSVGSKSECRPNTQM